MPAMNPLAAQLSADPSADPFGGGAAPAPAGPAGGALSPDGDGLPMGMPDNDADDMGGAPQGDPMFPSTDPQMMAQILAQALQAQQGDQAHLASMQQAALMGNPLMQALMSGAPMAPGAGQDGQGVGPETPMAPADPSMPGI